MGKTNLVALGFHIIIAILSLTIFPILLGGTGEIGMVLSIVYMVLPLLLYLIVGCRIKPMKTMLQDVGFVILIAVIGVFLWLVCYSKSHNNFNIKEAQGEAWFLYYVYISGTGYIDSFISQSTNIDNSVRPYMLLIHSFVPSILILIGIELRRAYNKLFAGFTESRTGRK